MEEVQELLNFIEKSPSPFHVIENMKEQLLEEGLEELNEQDHWDLKRGHSYFVTRNGSSMIAFRIPENEISGFQVIASHSDSPTFRIKEHAEMKVEGHYTKLNVEKYGGMLMAPWFDRPLSVAGRVVVKEGYQIKTRLVAIDRDLVLIPNVAIHMNRDINNGYKYNPQVDMLPLFAEGNEKDGLLSLVAKELGVERNDILSHELSLYVRGKGTVWGEHEEFISSPKLDDLECVYASMKGFLRAKDPKAATVLCVYDNEEVGSGTKQGAASTLLKDTLKRVIMAFGGGEEEYQRTINASFMVSADNGHALHPNHPEKADPINHPKMNGGILIKHSANQKYTTDAVSAAVMRMLCQENKIPYQDFVNRSDILGGSTLGNLSSMQVPMNTVDIGVAQLSMHSPYETGGAKDVANLVKMAYAFYSSNICKHRDGEYRIEFGAGGKNEDH